MSEVKNTHLPRLSTRARETKVRQSGARQACKRRRTRRLREPRLAGQRARRPRWRRRRRNRSEHACHSTLTRTTLQTRVCSVGNARQLLLVEKTRGRIQEAQTSKRSPLWRLSGRRSCRRLSTSCQTSKRPSAGRPPSCTCSCLGADRSSLVHTCVLLPAVRLRCVKSHALLYASVLPRRVAATLLAGARRRRGRGGRARARARGAPARLFSVQIPEKQIPNRGTVWHLRPLVAHDPDTRHPDCIERPQPVRARGRGQARGTHAARSSRPHERRRNSSTSTRSL